MSTSLNRFDKIAPCYDGLVKLIFGGVIRKAKLSHLELIKPEDHVLILGGGTGEVLESILLKNKKQKITYIEASQKMIQKACKKVAVIEPELVDFVHNNKFNSINYGEHEVIITNFFLDLFTDEQLNVIGAELYKSLAGNGIWIFTDFRVTKKSAFWQAPFVWVMYMFFRFTTGLKTNRLADFHNFFQSKNLKEVNNALFYSGMIESVVFKKC